MNFYNLDQGFFFDECIEAMLNFEAISERVYRLIFQKSSFLIVVIELEVEDAWKMVEPWLTWVRSDDKSLPWASS